MKKVKIPEFVAEWVEVLKEHSCSLDQGFIGLEEYDRKETFDYIFGEDSEKNSEKFAKAFMFGYEIEELD